MQLVYTRSFSLTHPIPVNNGKLYIAVDRRPQPQQPSSSDKPPKLSQDEHMQVDDTKDRVYIHSLDDELADIESDDEKLTFLPDIEAHLNKIPKHILTGQKLDEKEGQELVLYTVPTSLSVPSDQDSVRKAILEARQRAQDKVSQCVRAAVEEGRYRHGDIAETAHGFGEDDYIDDQDEDAMDMS